MTLLPMFTKPFATNAAYGRAASAAVDPSNGTIMRVGFSDKAAPRGERDALAHEIGGPSVGAAQEPLCNQSRAAGRPPSASSGQTPHRSIDFTGRSSNRTEIG